MTAVREGVPTVVVEKTDILSVQGNCLTRFVCPTQYEWPASSWQGGVYPHGERDMPLRWVRGFTAETVRGMRKRAIDPFRREHASLLRLATPARFLGYRIDPATRLIITELRFDGEPPENLPDLPGYAMLVRCAGFPAQQTEVPDFEAERHTHICICAGGERVEAAGEQTTVGRYTGHKFWEADKYDVDDPHGMYRCGQRLLKDKPLELA